MRLILLVLLIFFTSCNKKKECIDIDGNAYETIQIGEQLWMAENLKTTHYCDGTAIPTGYSNSEWVKLTVDAYAVYPAYNDKASITSCKEDCANVYGNLYNWYVTNDSRGICPEGFHIPSYKDWIILTNYLAPESSDSLLGHLPINTIAGGMMKSLGIIDNGDGYWNKDDLPPIHEVGTNESGFAAFPGGYRNCNRPNGGHYEWMGKVGYYWSSSESNGNLDMAWAQELWYHDHKIISFYHNQWTGFSIRCLED